MIGALRTPGEDRWYRLSIAGLIVGAWAALAVWGASPFADLLGHDPASSPGVPAPVRLAAFVVGWTLMTTAMMLPGSLPLINLFRRMVRRRPDAPRLIRWLVGGYLAVWAGFGLLAYLGDQALHAAVALVATPAAAAGPIAATILLTAGLYQLAPLKEACLDRCRSPYALLAAHWHGGNGGHEALRLGARHGLFCVGCCWALMLVMLAIGGANLGWMLILGAAMTVERATPWGQRLSGPLAAILIVWAGLHVARVGLLGA